MNNILTIDIEDYYMVSAFAEVIPFNSWSNYESRVVNNTKRILHILKEFHAKATFFVLGWVAEKYPDLVCEIFQDGHEIASHGYAHQLVYNQTPDEFRDDIRRTKYILEKIIAMPVLGYRAPSYSIRNRNLWALDILVKEGFLYDSSIFPAYHARGGISNAYRYPSRIKANMESIIEIPLSTIRLFGYNIPMAGGGYFRIIPYLLIQKSIQIINAKSQPAVFYLHPWEIDPLKPRVSIHGMSKFKHYLNLDKVENRFRRLLEDFKFLSIKEYINLNIKSLG